MKIFILIFSLNVILSCNTSFSEIDKIDLSCCCSKEDTQILNSAILKLDKYLSLHFSQFDEKERVRMFLIEYSKMLKDDNNNFQELKNSFIIFKEEYNNLRHNNFFLKYEKELKRDEYIDMQYNILKINNPYLKKSEVYFFQFEANHINSNFYSCLYSNLKTDEITRGWIESKLTTSSLGIGKIEFLINIDSNKTLNNPVFKLLIFTDIIIPYLNN